MPAFRFEALDATGKTVNGLVDADTPKAARAQLRTQHMVPLKVVPVQVAGQVDNDVLVSGGVRAGQNVVTAGVNLLKPGQKVRILTADVARRLDAEAAMSAKDGAAQ